MKIIKAFITGVEYIAPFNEPYKRNRLQLDSIRVVYDNGGHDEYLNSMFGFKACQEFYNILPNECKVTLNIKKVEDRDLYYSESAFKSACYNRTNENPYQLPKWTTL